MFPRRLFRLSSTRQVSLSFLHSPRSMPLSADNRHNIILAAHNRASYSSSSALQGQLFPPRRFPSSGFVTLDASLKVEEETLPFYNPKLFYPVRIGDVLESRYQIVTKLGFGGNSTVWLCRDLWGDQRFVVLKIHMNSMDYTREVELDRYLKSVEPAEHIGPSMIRMLEDAFKLNGPYGIHDVFVLPPLGMSLSDYRRHTEHGVIRELELVKMILRQVLLPVDWLHNNANVTHIDLHAGNFLIGITDPAVVAQFEEAEITNPLTIHTSQAMVSNWGMIHLADLGQARIGSEHTGLAGPVQYRAPEVLLDMTWGHPVDMWSIGLMVWDLVEPEGLFRVYDENDSKLNEAHHLAHMIALMGDPPLQFLQRSPKARLYWDENGQWRGFVEIPIGRTFESLETSLEQGSEDRELFLDLIRGLVCWVPEERLVTAEAYSHYWIYTGPTEETTE